MATAQQTSPTQSYPHLTFHDGVARIGDTRFKVKYLASAHHFRGWDAEELMRQFPVLKPVEVYAALTYFYDHREEILRDLEEERREGERLAKDQKPSREELLARWHARQQSQ
jgi:uncharacterized protein (DUF433 family)